MALSLHSLHVGTIVDRISEWGEDGKERPLETVLRGIIVKMDGSSMEQNVTNLYVSFGPSHGRPIEVNGRQVNAVQAKASELVEVFDFESKESRVAWRRIFGMPVVVGAEFAQKKNRSRRKMVKDDLALTPKPKDGVVTDGDDLGVSHMELPEVNG